MRCGEGGAVLKHVIAPILISCKNTAEVLRGRWGSNRFFFDGAMYWASEGSPRAAGYLFLL